MADVERQIVELSTLATVPPPPVQTDEEIMALIHEKLYQTDDLARVDFSDHIPALVDDLFETYKISP